ncbi:MAG: DUF1566 domain-containing protein [Puia sp.]|nr:DUF1566 domain-containing protein [Puia sp.]
MKQFSAAVFICLPMVVAKIHPVSDSRPLRIASIHAKILVPAHSIGEKYGGGVVFYISDEGQHGLIAATADQNPGIPWYNGLTRHAGSESDGLGAGVTNTKAIVAALIRDDANGRFAARVCADYSVKSGGIAYADWYLPSKFELNLLFLQKKMVGGFANTNYWSSTEYKTNSVWIQEFGSGHQRVSNSESYANAVRAIRAF